MHRCGGGGCVRWQPSRVVATRLLHGRIAAMSVVGRRGDHFVPNCGRAVDRGRFRTSRATGGRSGAVLVDLVAVFRSCTAPSWVQSGLAVNGRRGPGAGPGSAPDKQVRSGGAPAPD